MLNHTSTKEEIQPCIDELAELFSQAINEVFEKYEVDGFVETFYNWIIESALDKGIDKCRQ